jgi:hypothetical protein
MGGSWLGTDATNQEDNHSYFPISSYFEIDSTIDLMFEEILNSPLQPFLKRAFLAYKGEG